jgi:hypothetical protein
VSTSKHGFAPKAPGGTTSFLRADGTWAAPAASSGDTSSNTATSVDGEAVVFSGTGGKTVKRATGTGVAKLTAGVLSTATAGSDYSAGTSGLATGILKSTTSTGALSIATAGTDYSTLALTATTPSALGTAAVGSGTTAAKSDHVHPTTGLALLTENVNTVATSSTAQTIPAVSTATINSITLTANCTLTFPTATAGTSFLLRLAQDATGSRTVTWPATVKWAGAVAPTLSTGVSKVDYLTFVCVDGSTWFGSVAGLDVR